MAGAFGFQKEHFDVSIKCGERVMLPAVRAAGEQDLIVADGVSCREQIAQGTDRHALHFAEGVRLARRQGGARSAAEPAQPAESRVDARAWANRRARKTDEEQADQ
jgi:hypothetical protein